MAQIKSHISLTVSSVLLLSLFCSCEKVLDIGTLSEERFITVNALPCADSQMFVNITYSRFFLDNSDFETVDDVYVVLYSNGVEMISTQQDCANHFFDYTVKEGDSISLLITIAGRNDITGSSHVPFFPDMSVPLTEVDTTQPFTMGDINFTLNDRAGESNYYRIYVDERDSGSRWNRYEERWDTIDTTVHPFFVCLNSEITSSAVNVTEGFMNYYNSLLFSDSLIEGLNYDIKVSLTFLRDTSEHPLLRQYRIVVESLSPEAFKYFRDITSMGGIESFFAEPSAIFNNLSGGAIGIVAGIARREVYVSF